MNSLFLLGFAATSSTKVGSTRFDVQGTGITIIISVDTLHIHQRLPCSNRYSYLELFSDYPRRDKFLYAKSQQTFDLPKEVVLGAGDAKNARREDEHDQSDGRKGSKADQNLCTIKLGSDLKNVKLKIPKVPFTIRGRLMAQDTFFATVVAVFQLDISKGHLQDMREAEVPGDKPPKVSEAEVPLLLVLTLQLLASLVIGRGHLARLELVWYSSRSEPFPAPFC